MSIHKFLMKSIIVGGVLAAVNIMGISAAARADITGTVVNIRKEPSTQSTVIAKARQGQTISVISHDGEWLKVTLENGTEAYVSAEFATITDADGLVSDDGINIRTAPTVTAEVIGKAQSGDQLTAIGRSGDFYAFSVDGATAYIHKDYLLGDLLPLLPTIDSTAAKPETAAADAKFAKVISATGLNLRAEATVESAVLATIAQGGVAEVVQAGTEWHKVTFNGRTGYISAEFAVLQAEAVSTGSTTGNAIAAYAQQFLGTRYAWGGTNLNSGVDCSGFVFAVYRDLGYRLNRVSRDQINNGVRVNRSELQPGDLVFFDTTNATNRGYISHVGIYIGNGQFVHASSSTRTPYVVIHSLSETYYNTRYVGACRVVQ